MKTYHTNKLPLNKLNRIETKFLKSLGWEAIGGKTIKGDKHVEVKGHADKHSAPHIIDARFEHTCNFCASSKCEGECARMPEPRW